MSILRKIQALPIKYHGQKIFEVKISGKRFTNDKIEKEVKQYMARHPDKQFQVVLPFDGGWRSGLWFRSNESISLFDSGNYYDETECPEDAIPKDFDSFIVYIRKQPVLAGGCDNAKNDCLYLCLWKAYGLQSAMPEGFKTPANLKKKLGLNRSDPVPVSLIPTLETLMKTICINIIGEANYHSTRTSHRKITLILANGHYSISENSKRKKSKAWSNEPKKPVVYHSDPIKNKVEFYDGKDSWIESLADLNKLKSRRWSGDVCLVSAKKTETLEEAFNRFNTEADALLEATKRSYLPLDLRMTGGSYKIAALWLFSKLSRSIPENEPLDPLEAKWISDAMKGGLIWGEKDWAGHAEQYDVTSMYPHLLRKITFPVRKGKFQKLEDFQYNHPKGGDYTYYGLYKADVERKDLAQKLFRYNQTEIYTHIDLRRARALGLNVSLSPDTPNALIYGSKTNFPGECMFGPYIDLLFQIKNKGSPASIPAKRILCTLWGALCQRKHNYTAIGKGTEYTAESLFEIPEAQILDTIIPMNDDSQLVKYHDPAEIFEGEYPRVAPFLLALGRKTISEIIQPYADRLKRVHTDGFVLESNAAEPPIIPVSENAAQTLGDLKFEKRGQCKVLNSMRITWE